MAKKPLRSNLDFEYKPTNFAEFDKNKKTVPGKKSTVKTAQKSSKKK